MPKVQIKIKPNKRYTFFGKTRSGKSFLAWYMLRAFAKDKTRQIIFIDAKFEHKQFGDGTVLDYPKLVNKYDPKAHIQIFQTFTWTPHLDEMVDKLLIRGNAIVVLDELGGIADAHSAPKGIVKLWTQGGGKGVGAWAMLQTCTGTPSVIKKQTELYFMFKMNDENERKDILKYIPDKRIVQDRLPLHYFWLFSDDMDNAIKCKPIVVSERKRPS